MLRALWAHGRRGGVRGVHRRHRHRPDGRDFADGAREGGSNYWCDQLHCLRPADQPGTYFGEKLAAGAWYAAAEYDDDPRQRDWHPLDTARMRAGIARAAEHFGRPIDEFNEQHDAGDADIAFQFAILGDIVYG